MPCHCSHLHQRQYDQRTLFTKMTVHAHTHTHTHFNTHHYKRATSSRASLGYFKCKTTSGPWEPLSRWGSGRGEGPRPPTPRLLSSSSSSSRRNTGVAYKATAPAFSTRGLGPRGSLAQPQGYPGTVSPCHPTRCMARAAAERPAWEQRPLTSGSGEQWGSS